MEQPNDIGSRKDLVLYRIESSKEDLQSAKILLNAESYKAANNRAYYATVRGGRTHRLRISVSQRNVIDRMGKIYL